MSEFKNVPGLASTSSFRRLSPPGQSRRFRAVPTEPGSPSITDMKHRHCPCRRYSVRSQRTQIIRHVAQPSQHRRIAAIARGGVASAAECDGTRMAQLTVGAYPRVRVSVNRHIDAQAVVAPGAVCDAINDVRQEIVLGRVDREAVSEALTKLQDRQTKAMIETLGFKDDAVALFDKFVSQSSRRCFLAINALRPQNTTTFKSGNLSRKACVSGTASRT